MKKSLLFVASTFIVVLALISSWPNQSNSERALSMAREACGLEHSKGKWEFVTGKNARDQDLETLLPGEKNSQVTLTTEQATLAHRAAILDSRWIPLADAVTKLAVYQTWSLDNSSLSTETKMYLIEGNINSLFICEAIKAESNS